MKAGAHFVLGEGYEFAWDIHEECGLRNIPEGPGAWMRAYKRPPEIIWGYPWY